ncbi:hypothetical protein DL770_005573 [Monosporascus sp. CRB-9-2]|nr:hypothetical protein DL770_005573 [Monosporascus sp. CRB-9-2]
MNRCAAKYRSDFVSRRRGTRRDLFEERHCVASPSGRWYFGDSPNNGFNESTSDHPLPPSPRGHFPPGYGNAEETEAALAFARSMQPETDEDELGDSRQDFRRILNNEVMVPMLDAFARRLAHIRSLKSACMTRRSWGSGATVDYSKFLGPAGEVH